MASSGNAAAKRPDPQGSGRRRGRPVIIDREQLAQLWQDGAPATEIADHFGVCRQAIHDAVRRYELPPRGRRRPLPRTEIVADPVLEQLRLTMSVGELAEHLEVSRRTVERWLRAAGLS